MLITDKFIYIHMPKTGGTFVTEVILRLNEIKIDSHWLSRFLPESLFSCKRPLVDINARSLVDLFKHEMCYRVPKKNRNKLVLATVRNPYDRYVSQYEFGWWRKRPDTFGGDDRARDLYPHFPNITFEEFIDMINVLYTKLDNDNFSSEESLGHQTELFVRYFFKKPAQVFSTIDAEYIESERYKDDIWDNIHFVHTRTLNRDLYNFLVGLGYPPRHLEFIINMEKVFPPEGGRTKEQKWEKYYTPELKEKVRVKERLLFNIFPEFDV